MIKYIMFRINKSDKNTKYTELQDRMQLKTKQNSIFPKSIGNVSYFSMQNQDFQIRTYCNCLFSPLKNVILAHNHCCLSSFRSSILKLFFFIFPIRVWTIWSKRLCLSHFVSLFPIIHRVIAQIFPERNTHAGYLFNSIYPYICYTCV